MSDKLYRFGEQTITVSDDLTVDQVREIWEPVHPSLANAEAMTLEDGSVRFEVRAGTKGSDKLYRFGEQTITVSDDLTVDQVREIWEPVHPSLANAEAMTLEDGSVRFEVRAGTKG